MDELTTVNPLENITRIEYHGQLVLTTAQLAEFYGTTVNNLKRNFVNNSDRYVEGKHYFKIEGVELDELRGKIFHLQISPMTRTLYLWTKRGCARHCKSVGTDKAWEVFELLEDTYFNLLINPEKPLVSLTDFERGKELARLASHTKDPYKRERLVARAANLLLSEEFFHVPAKQVTLFN